MRKSRFDEAQVVGILREARSGRKLDEVCRTHGISRETLKRWRAKYGRLDVAEAERLRRLDEENRQLKRALADLSLDNQMLRDVVSRKW
jgi:putative transposase